MDKILPIIGFGFLAFIVIYPFLNINTRPRCRECGGRKIGVEKSPTGIHDSNYCAGGGSEGGGYSTVSVLYNMKYRCNDCQAEWATTATETG